LTICARLRLMQAVPLANPCAIRSSSRQPRCSLSRPGCPVRTSPDRTNPVRANPIRAPSWSWPSNATTQRPAPPSSSRSYPPPPRDDLATNATFTVLAGQRSDNGAELTALHDGKLPGSGRRAERELLLRGRQRRPAAHRPRQTDRGGRGEHLFVASGPARARSVTRCLRRLARPRASTQHRPATSIPPPAAGPRSPPSTPARGCSAPAANTVSASAAPPARSAPAATCCSTCRPPTATTATARRSGARSTSTARRPPQRRSSPTPRTASTRSRSTSPRPPPCRSGPRRPCCPW
jgi:hypothetical protein